MEFKMNADGVVSTATEADHIKSNLDSVMELMFEIKALHVLENGTLRDVRTFLLEHHIISKNVSDSEIEDTMELIVEEFESIEQVLRTLLLTMDDIELFVQMYDRRVNYNKEDKDSAID